MQVITAHSIHSREHLLKGLQAFREALAHPPKPKPPFHITYTVLRPQNPQSLDQYDQYRIHALDN
jgi:hypothetical protein